MRHDLAIDGDVIPCGDYFLHHVRDRPETGTYRIFEPEWREVILLWLGREGVDDELKNQFIKIIQNQTPAYTN